jgi:hypothetical protein
MYIIIGCTTFLTINQIKSKTILHFELVVLLL